MDHVNCWCDAPLPSVADRPVELGKPREWPYPVGIPQGLLSNEALRRNTQRDAYEQTLHAQGLTSERCTCSDCCCWRVEQRRAGDDVSLCHCKECEGGYHEIDSARNAMPRKTFDGPVFDWKPLVSKTDQEFARYASEATEQIVRAYTMTPEMLGITEKPKSVSELSVKIEADVDPVINALKALRGASPDMLFVSPKDAERLFGLYDKPACNTKENPMSISSNPVADLADRARELAKDGKENLDAVKSAIEQGKIEY